MRKRPELPKTLSRTEAEKLVRGVLEDSSNIVWRNHVYQRMQERYVTDMQVLQVLKSGTCVNEPEWTNERNWKVTLEADTAGDLIRVGAVLDVDRMGFLIIVITVIVCKE